MNPELHFVCMNGVMEGHKYLQLAHQYSSESQKYLLASRVCPETLNPHVDVLHSYMYLREAYTYLRFALKYMQISCSCMNHLGLMPTHQILVPGRLQTNSPVSPNQSLDNQQQNPTS